MSKGDFRIALVHDELIRRGGAEVVFEELVRIFPHADIYTLYAGEPWLNLGEIQKPIATSFLQRFPTWFRRHPGRVLPFLLPAAEQFDFSAYDIVLSSASAFAKAIITRSGVPHVCYCHTPTRYLWEPTQLALRGPKLLAMPLLHYLRMADYAGAQRVDYYLANSKYTQQRIKKYYGRESEVVYPPIRTEFYTPKSSGSAFAEASAGRQRPFLVVGRLTPTKHFEQAIAVCEKLQLPILVVGGGQAGAELTRRAGKYTTFTGTVSDEELRTYLRRARAVLIPGVEDFGMVAAEALACGTPVVAQARGGVKEIMTDGRHGILYDGQGVEALAEGLRRFSAAEARFQPEALQQQAMQFSSGIFHNSITKYIAKILERRHSTYG
ncbi:MAG: glycosyltransferase [Patescibacteria group bacterium]